MLSFILILAGTGVLYWLYLSSRYPKNFPPHPRFSIPIVGDTLLHFRNGPSTGMEALRQKLGDVYGIMVGNKRMVVLSDYDLIMEAGTKEEFLGRGGGGAEYFASQRGSPDPSNLDLVPGVLASRGTIWQEQRRFSLHALRDLGFGKNSTEELALEEAEELCKFLESTKGEPINIRNKFNIAILNTLWRICTSERLCYDDSRLVNLLLLLDKFVQEGGNPIVNLAVRYKPLCWLAVKLNLFAFGTIVSDLRKFMEDTISPLRESYQEDSLRNLVDHFIKMSHYQERLGLQKSFIGDLGKTNLVNLLIDLFIAGSETTSTTLSWGMLYMILNPTIQKKVQNELDTLVGKGIQPKNSDRSKTPYTEAVIHEIQRLGNIADRSVAHMATSDSKLSTGHFIPKDTLVICNIGRLSRDSDYFPEPLKFDPTRYLDKDGNFKPHPRVVPFGLGKRRCLGEVLAKMSLYIFFTSILSRFDLEKADAKDAPSTKPIEGIVTSPRPYELRFKPRK